jgi:hypothetical protein
MVSPHLVSPMIDIGVMPMQSSPNHIPVVEGDLSHVPIITHPIQPRVEEVVVPVQSLVNTILLLKGDSYFNHVVTISDTAPYEQVIFLFSLNTLPLSLGEVPFDWDGLVGYSMPLPMSFQVRYIIRYITEMVTSTRNLSSSTWTTLVFPNLVLAIRKILTFHRILAWEPRPPP